MISADVTVVIPHYQTLDAVRLCLRSIRHYTQPAPRVLVVDNGSQDASLDYLRGLRWIDVVDSGVGNDLIGAHAAALNTGAARVATPYFAIIHSDTYVHRAGWLAMLIGALERGGYAAVGSRHQTIRVYGAAPLAALALRAAPLLARHGGRATAAGVPWLRSCLTLYRTAAFRAAGAAFASDGKEDASHAAHAALVAHGERLLPLPDRVVGHYVFHKGDTTRIANRFYADDDADFRARITRHQRHVGGFYARAATRALLADERLDG
ncbi:MAG: glycosyltransferase [bacterium]